MPLVLEEQGFPMQSEEGSGNLVCQGHRVMAAEREDGYNANPSSSIDPVVLLGPIHSGIGVTKQGFRIQAVHWIQAHPDAEKLS